MLAAILADLLDPSWRRHRARGRLDSPCRRSSIRHRAARCLPGQGGFDLRRLVLAALECPNRTKTPPSHQAGRPGSLRRRRPQVLGVFVGSRGSLVSRQRRKQVRDFGSLFAFSLTLIFPVLLGRHLSSVPNDHAARHGGVQGVDAGLGNAGAVLHAQRFQVLVGGEFLQPGVGDGRGIQD